MKEFYTVSEIAKILNPLKPNTRALEIRFNNEKRLYREIKGQGPGGRKRIFALKDLPPEIQQKIIRTELDCRPDLVPSKKISEGRVKALMARWDRASEQNRRHAEGRLLILKAAEGFVRNQKSKRTAGFELFSFVYREKEVPDLEGWVYKLQPKISPATIRRFRKQYRENGIAGLLTKYGSNGGRGGAVTPEQRIFVVGHLKASPKIRPAHIYKILCKSFDPYPSRSSVYRFIKKWKKENLHLSTIIEDPRRWKNNLMPAFGDAAADVLWFCHTWEMDSTPADVITSDGKRCAVIGTIDVFSRRIRIIVAPTSKSLAIAACMRNAIIDWGIPDRIKKDNGRDYTSLHIEAITTALNIETPPLPKYTPEKKPFIERLFWTFSREFEELLPGYCGHSVADRMTMREQITWASKIMEPGSVVEVPLTLQEFQLAIDQWIGVYERSPHSGLDGGSPIDVAKESTSYPPKIRDERVLDVLLAPISRPRIVGKKGIAFEGAHFIAPELVNHVGKRVELRRDLDNAGLVFVFDATKKTFLCQAKDEALEGRSLEEYLIAKKRHVKALKNKAKALETLGLANRKPLQILLEDEIEHRETKVVQFQAEADNKAIREARRAVGQSPEDKDNLPEKPAKVTPIKPKRTIDPLSDSWMSEAEVNAEFEEIKNKSAKRMPQIG